MVRYLIWGFIAGLFGFPHSVHVRNEVNVEGGDGAESYASVDCANDCDYDGDGCGGEYGDSSGGE